MNSKSFESPWVKRATFAEKTNDLGLLTFVVK